MGASPIAAHDFYSQAQARSNLSDIVKELRAILRRASTLECAGQLHVWSNRCYRAFRHTSSCCRDLLATHCTVEHLVKNDVLHA